MLNRKNKEDIVLDMVVYTFMIIFLLTIIFPFWQLLVDSFSSKATANELGFKLWPTEFSFESYKEVILTDVVKMAYFNTIYRTVLGTITCVLITFCAAYPLSKRKLPFNKILTMMVIFTMFFSGGLIPEYLVVKNLNLINNRLVLFLPLIANGFYIMVMRNFLYSIPEELEESAFLDGANELTIAFKIMMPLSKPIIATISLFAAVLFWNEWFQAMIYVRDPDKTVLQLLLRRIIQENQISDLMIEMGGDDATKPVSEDSVRAATMFITIGPIIAAYPFAQKYFIRGMMTGAVKG